MFDYSVFYASHKDKNSWYNSNQSVFGMIIFIRQHSLNSFRQTSSQFHEG